MPARQIQQLTGHAEARAERHTGHQHHHRLHRERNGCERYAEADLSGGRGEQSHEHHCCRPYGERRLPGFTPIPERVNREPPANRVRLIAGLYLTCVQH